MTAIDRWREALRASGPLPGRTVAALPSSSAPTTSREVLGAMAIKLDKRRPPLRRRDPAKGPEVRLTIRLGVELVERIVAEATRRNVSRSESFRLAVSKGLDALARAREELDRTGA